MALGDVRYLSGAGETDRMGAMLADPLAASAPGTSGTSAPAWAGE